MTLDTPRTLASSSAPSWYPVLRSSRLGRKPIGISGLDERLVVWRGRAGKPIAFERYCPHHGADLVLGQVDRGGCLRCSFHGWKFDEAGRCVHIPQTDHIPAAAHRQPRHLIERYDLVWMWHGTPEPLFDLPTVPEFDPFPGHPRHVDLVHRAVHRAPVTRVLENTLDTEHFTKLHGLQGRVDVTVSDQPQWDHNDPRWPSYIEGGAWFGTVVTIRVEQLDRFGIADRIAGALRMPLSTIRIVADYSPSTVVQRVFIGDRHVNTILAAPTPFSAAHRGDAGTHALYMLNHTAPQGGRVRTALTHLFTSTQSRRLVTQDVPVWRTLDPAGSGVMVKSDTAIIAIRRWYGDWVRTTTSAAGPQPDLRLVATRPTADYAGPRQLRA